ncbi:MAG: hypothetical protein LBC52_08005 [Treponema sp.]|nr:hypothetical protein [Treponema sp.]
MYFEDDIGIFKVDGKANVNMYKQEVAIDGNGTRKDPKARLIIPSGDRKLTIGVKQMVSGISKTYGERRYEAPYTFVAGRYYQLATSENKDFKNPKLVDLEKQMKEMEDKAVELANQAETAEKTTTGRKR